MEWAAALAGIAACLEGERCQRVVTTLLKQNPQFNNAQRAFVAHAVAGVTCMQGQLKYIWRAAEPAGLLAVHLCNQGQNVKEAAARCGVEAALLEARLGQVKWPQDPVERLAAQESLPHFLAQLWWAQWGEAAHALARALNQPGPLTLRANTGRVSRDALMERLRGQGWAVSPTPWSPVGLRVEGHVNIKGCTEFREGLFEIQDEGSQLMAHLCCVAPGMTVVDFCAGSGGKTLALAALMENRGVIHAWDPNPARLSDLTGRFRRLGLGCVNVSPVPLQSVIADLVLVDAPCSAWGALRRSPDARWHMTPQEVTPFPKLQAEILRSAALHVIPGGLLVYVTCTFNRLENEDVAGVFLQEHPKFIAVTACVAGLVGTPHLTLLPHLHGTDGFFGACFVRGAG